jgi:cytokinesis protein
MSNPMTQAVVLLQEACNDLRDAKQFKALLNVILQMGNYINGSNYAGGAWGFKLSSINRVRLALATLCNNFALT